MGPFAIALMIGAAASATIPTRTPIGSLPVAPSKTVTHVEMMKVEFLPGQAMPQHMHSVPIACVVSKGSFAVSIGRDPRPDRIAWRHDARACGRRGSLFQKLVGDGAGRALLRHLGRLGRYPI
jgi:hypothetical protein